MGTATSSYVILGKPLPLLCTSVALRTELSGWAASGIGSATLGAGFLEHCGETRRAATVRGEQLVVPARGTEGEDGSKRASRPLSQS